MNKTTIIVIIILVIAGGIYFYTNGSPKIPDSLLQKQNPDAQASANRILSLLKQINSLQIKTNIFKSKEFQTLRDYSVEIMPQEVGRPNPFAPIPGMPVQTTRTPNR